MCLLDLNNKVIMQDAVKFVISERHKTSKPVKTLEVFFPTFPGNVKIVSHVKSTGISKSYRTTTSLQWTILFQSVYPICETT